MSLFLGKHESVKLRNKATTIKQVRAYVIGDKTSEEDAGGGADCHSQSEKHWIVDTPIANPMSAYDQYKVNRKNWGINVLGSVIVQVELMSGIIGVGISIGGEPACYIIENHLARFVEGQDVSNVELIWDQMYRATVNYGRKGLPIQAISAVDLAIWDCLGKHHKVPVYKLIGGKTKEKLPIYATTARPDLAKKMGFHGAKFPLPYGPADGDEGMRKNIERIKNIRKSVGPDYPIMIDCYMSLTVNYSIQLCQQIEKHVPNGVKWVEEFLHPDDYEGYAEVKRRVSTCLLTTGEHEYTRYGFQKLLSKGCCDVLQPDITWCGGLTEARRIVAMASAYDIPVIPHGSSVYSYHLQIANTNCPMAEYLVLSANGDTISPLFGDLFVDEPLPVDGYLSLDANKFGFGVTLNKKLKLRRPHERMLRPFKEIQEEQIAAVPDHSEWINKAGRINLNSNSTALFSSSKKTKTKAVVAAAGSTATPKDKKQPGIIVKKTTTEMKDGLKSYFEQFGAVKKMSFNFGKWFVYFEEESVIDKVLAQEHTLEGAEQPLEVVRYQPASK